MYIQPLSQQKDSFRLVKAACARSGHHSTEERRQQWPVVLSILALLSDVRILLGILPGSVTPLEDLDLH